ncbi:hypothetical protein J2T57_002632 [Natronocella acetinitrilica]|uniref:Uncharacterized protein n=1 Tax=Natronocella acetinitrilica TaxID=414046 RepID=A0AAE3G503_9GAMM|nr:hypothetical protein [Natronocella acetinitrilica]MCP1675482.1 hypothetical protein [Natronocella acetinitrilica]
MSRQDGERQLRHIREVLMATVIPHLVARYQTHAEGVGAVGAEPRPAPFLSAKNSTEAQR